MRTVRVIGPGWEAAGEVVQVAPFCTRIAYADGGSGEARHDWFNTRTRLRNGDHFDKLAFEDLPE